MAPAEVLAHTLNPHNPLDLDLDLDLNSYPEIGLCDAAKNDKLNLSDPAITYAGSPTLGLRVFQGLSDQSRSDNFQTGNGNESFLQQLPNSLIMTQTETSRSQCQNQQIPRDFKHQDFDLSLTAASNGSEAYFEKFQNSRVFSLDKLPVELLQLVFHYVMVTSKDGESLRNMSKLIPVCSKFYLIGTPLLYRHVSIRYSRSFDLFRETLNLHPVYGELVSCLDFSSFTSVGLGRTGKMNQEIQMVTASTILNALELCPNLEEFLMAESIDMDVDYRILDHLVNKPSMKSIDFCGSSARLTNSLLSSKLCYGSNDFIYNLENISFHGCSTIPSQAFEQILSKLVNLKKLDLTHTLVMPEALEKIPHSANLTHLSLARCYQLTSDGLLRFLLLHPSTKNLTWLSIMYEVTRPNPYKQKDFETILRYLPRQLEYLNVYGLPMKESYMGYLVNLPNLAGLSLGYSDLSSDCLFHYLPLLKGLKYLDLTGVPAVSAWLLHDRSFYALNNQLEVIEISPEKAEKLRNTFISPGWDVESGKGRRGWLFKVPESMCTALEAASYLKTTMIRRPLGGYSSYKSKRLTSSGPTSRSYLGGMSDNSSMDAINPVRIATINDLDPWTLYGSRKINMCQVGFGGYPNLEAVKQQGIYCYYGYHHA